MTRADRERWDARYRTAGVASGGDIEAPDVFAHHEHLLPEKGAALEIACGRGRGAVWLASKGFEVLAVDVSPVAIEAARTLADRLDLGDRIRFDVHDLDDGLPDGPAVDLILCHLFRDQRLDDDIVGRLRLGGMLWMACLSEVGASPGRFRARRGELLDAFGELDIVVHEERDGTATLIAIKT